MLAVAQLPSMIAAAPLVLIENPECYTDVGGDKELTGQDDDGLYFIVFNESLPDVVGISITQCSVGKQEARHTRERPEMGEDMENPRIVGIALWRQAVVSPPRVGAQVVVPPALEVERRVGHDIVEVKSTVEIIGEGGVALRPEVVADAAQGQVHLGQPVGGSLFLLSIHVDTTDVAPFGLHQFGALNEHAARAAARVVERAVERFYHRSDEAHHIVRGVELALLFGGIDGKLLEEILIHASDEVFLLTESLMADFVDLINDTLDVVGSEVALCESAFHEASA